MEGSYWVNIYIFINRFFKRQPHKMVKLKQFVGNILKQNSFPGSTY